MVLRILLFWASLLALIIDHAESYRVQTERDALAYLETYGYVDPKDMPQGYSMKDCNKKLIEFQKLAKVNVSGVLDDDTLDAMNRPRCGCPDFIHLSFNNDEDVSYRGKRNNHRDTSRNSSFEHHHSHNHRHHHHQHQPDRHTSRSRRSRFKRFVLSERRWEKAVVTYNIVRYPTRSLRVSRSEIDEAIHNAFTIWKKHINLDFVYQPNEIEVDIEISFVSGHHGDHYPFDGPGNTLAHAFFPGSGIGGDVHFEQDEDWGLGSYNAVDVLYVAVHELGHSLGLGHSSDYGAVMYPMYRGYTPNLQLHPDDVSGVQSMYGRRPSVPAPATPSTRRTTTTTTRRPYYPPPTPTTRRPYYPPTAATTTARSRTTTTPRPRPGSDNHDFCEDAQIDDITTTPDGTILAFKGEYVYEISRNGEGILPGWPQRIDNYFRGLEGNIDCVVTRTNGKTYFFKDTRYWRFTGRQMDRGYPRGIADHFPGIPDHLNAGFEWDGEFVFTKGDQFWRFNTRRRPQVQHFFPMPLDHWGLTKPLDAAFTAPNGTVYFFQGEYFWEFDKNSHQIRNKQYGPAESTERWFGCTEP